MSRCCWRPTEGTSPSCRVCSPAVRTTWTGCLASLSKRSLNTRGTSTRPAESRRSRWPDDHSYVLWAGRNNGFTSGYEEYKSCLHFKNGRALQKSTYILPQNFCVAFTFTLKMTNCIVQSTTSKATDLPPYHRRSLKIKLWKMYF